MPCQSESYSDLYEDVLKENRKLTQMLCLAMTVYNSGGDSHAQMERECGVTWYEVKKWWILHQEEDAKRKQKIKEAAQEYQERQAALKKLTPRERKLLGTK